MHGRRAVYRVRAPAMLRARVRVRVRAQACIMSMALRVGSSQGLEDDGRG